MKGGEKDDVELPALREAVSDGGADGCPSSYMWFEPSHRHQAVH